MNVCCFPLIHCSTIFHQMVPILFTFRKVVCERVCVFCECTQRLTFNLQWKSTEKMCACVCCRLWELIFDQKLIMFFFLRGPMPGDTSLYFYYYTMDFFSFFQVALCGRILRLAFSLSQNQRHHVLAVSQQVYWISSSSAFFASIKSLFFGAYELLIVHIIHCKLSSKLNYFSSSNGRGVQNFASVAATTFSFFQSESTFNALFCWSCCFVRGFCK